MRVLVCCEESQAIANAYRFFGVEAFSCDLKPCSGNHPEYHIQGDCFDYVFDSWDLIIAHPPCTDLCVSGARWFPAKIADGRQARSIDFFMRFVDLPCPRVCIENPIGIMSTVYRKPDQIIQPWQFGHPETKATCLWLKGLPPLIPTCVVAGRGHSVWRCPPGPERSVIRSKTFPGIASAIALQWRF